MNYMVKRNGFTLIEILVVIGLMSILTAIGSFSYVNYSERSRDSRRKIDLQQLRSALELYRSNTTDGVYPTISEYGSGTSSVLVTKGLLQTIPLDPLKAPYTYAPLPAGCNNTAVYCTSYSLQTMLETTGKSYSVSPNSIN